VGVLIIKPLADALRDNDVIRAVIRVSLTNVLNLHLNTVSNLGV